RRRRLRRRRRGPRAALGRFAPPRPGGTPDAHPPGSPPDLHPRPRHPRRPTHRGDLARHPPRCRASGRGCCRRGGMVTRTPDHTEIDVDTALDRAADAIRGASRVTLVCHVNPDGDALGSTLGLHHVLCAAGVDSVASFPSPFVVAPHYRELPGLELLTPPELVDRDPEVLVTFDCGALDRLGDLDTCAKGAAELIVVDHHASNERYGTINVIDVTAAASGVLVRRLIDRLGLPLNRDAAVCLYAAVVCDTGRFQYESTTPDVFDLARELAGYDLPISSLSRTLFEEH